MNGTGVAGRRETQREKGTRSRRSRPSFLVMPRQGPTREFRKKTAIFIKHGTELLEIEDQPEGEPRRHAKAVYLCKLHPGFTFRIELLNVENWHYSKAEKNLSFCPFCNRRLRSNTVEVTEDKPLGADLAPRSLSQPTLLLPPITELFRNLPPSASQP